MAWITDSLRGAIEAVGRLNPFGRSATGISGIFTHQIALAIYMSSGMMRRVIAIPAADRTQKWRDWQAKKEIIAKIEAEEKRLGLRAKTREAEVLRGTGGGAFIVITAGNHDQPLTPDQVGEGGIVAINVVSRWEITPREFVKELSSPDYRLPEYFEIDTGAKRERIHPSRVICFRGDKVPAGSAVDDIELFWGDSRLMQISTAVQNSDHTQLWFVELVKKAKLLRVGIPDLLDMLSDPTRRKELDERIALIAQGESTLNATVYRSGTGPDDPGEKIDDYQINWAGIPAFMDAIDQRISAVSGIPFTKLQGRSPAGMNATGQHDLDNWWDTVGDGQENETRPCLEQLDPFLLRSAGVSKPDDVWWVWAPLRKPTEKEEAETFGLLMDAIAKLIDSGMVPHEALAEAVQNLIEERGYMPGLADVLAKMSDDERFGKEPDAPDPDETDPSAIQANPNGGKEADPTSPTGRTPSGSPASARAANDAATWLNDATPRPLYVSRKLLNGDDLAAWAKANGFTSTLSASDMHVTVLYSRQPVDPMKMGRDWREDDKGRITVRPGGPRAIEKLGENAVVLRFACPDLDWRHRDMIEAGGSHDYPEYQPHVTISYQAPEGVDLDALKPFAGELRFGPEQFETLDLDWKRKVVEE